jgi:hypothetical protein
MPVALDFSIPPLSHLSAPEQRKLAAAADIAFLRPGEVLIQAGEAPAHLYLIVKGLVSERAGDDVITVHGAGSRPARSPRPRRQRRSERSRLERMVPLHYTASWAGRPPDAQLTYRTRARI